MVCISRVTLLLEVFSGVRRKLPVHELIFLVLMALCFIDKAAAQLLQLHITDLPSRTARYAPTAICSRKPQGVSSSKLDGTNGFFIEIENFPQKYVPGQTYEVSILGRPLPGASAHQKFVDFTLTVESSDYNRLNPDVGVFKLSSDQLTRFSEDCPYSVTATSTVQKSRASVRWTAPPSGSGCVVFKASVVEEGERWYADDGELTRELCQDFENTDDQGETLEQCCACEEAKYEVAFEGLWSRYTHPKSYPENEWDVRFSNITGASHAASYRIWEYGGFATEGVRHLAETGLTKALETELKLQSGNIRTVIKAQGLRYPNLKKKTFAVFRVDRKNHVVSLLSRMNPSPDWMVGVSSLELCLANCTWVAEKIINLYPWDAGTREGHTYYPETVEQSEPPQRIRKITSSYPPDPEAPFYDETGTPMKPVARLTISRQRLYEKVCGADEERMAGTVDQPIDDMRDECASHEWTAFGPCNQNCVRVRSRAYQFLEKAQAAQCRSTLVHTIPCEECGTFNCETTPWSSWEDCPVTCGRGWRTRHRRFKNKMANKVCSQELMQKIPCEGTLPECTDDVIPSECAVTEWTEWSPCTESCGEGITQRTRLYRDERIATLNQCGVELLQEKACFGDECGSLEPYERCRLPKDEGRACRGQFQRYYYNPDQRKCVHFVYTGCHGNANNFKTYEECRDECEIPLTGDSGDYETSIVSGGPTFPGESDPIQKDSSHSGPGGHRTGGAGSIDCVVSKWTPWSQCSQTCGTSRKERYRRIITPAQNGGRPCPEKLIQRRRCDTPPCPIDCQLSQWTRWGPCSKTCGSGFRERTRSIKSSNEVPFEYPATIKDAK
ncbi:spondin-1-like isoform X3 [Varroa jacobsoni]|uniref:Spondin-1 n=1 Tax=Varroa destructor TaxID=109461 RepID=A0A7M7JNT9_VARDE|nr:spondin-1-like isoform X3 [Varroa destructor]XP_022694971.1 spondin-1-like isoform X3 [Varroa jacobsoni]